jgi:methylenetetrahydrofolate dehydrogenase (NADP+)/methenyltetrahydrofolate cyclohydrolase
VAAVAAQVDGVVVQLPFPPHIDREAVLQAVPVEKDPDGFSYEREALACMPPVTGAIIEIAKTHDVSFLDKRIVVLGQGRLVGGPITHYLKAINATVTVLDQADTAEGLAIKDADIVITGIGRAHFVTEVMVKEGVVIFDAGTSEDGGVVAGDVHPAVAQKSALFTPVPGGIGPITVAVLLRNLVTLVERQQK